MHQKQIGRYRIDSELGQGAMGVVYKALDPLIERTVAIKTIKLDPAQAELKDFETRFLLEAKSAGRLNHPNIVTIYDVGKSGDLAYMAMEYLEGRLLKDLLDAHAALGLERIVDIAAQVADALAYAHRNGVVHRDIKPDNIMILRDGLVKITDFGIAQLPVSSATQAGTLLGSPRYMAPEQVAGQRVDGRTDIYALGVVLYEMLTGETPFYAEHLTALMYRIVHEAPQPPMELNPKIPARLNRIVMKALAKDPNERYQDAAELARDLRQCLADGLPSLTRPLQSGTGQPDPFPAPVRAGRHSRADARTLVIVPESLAAAGRDGWLRRHRTALLLTLGLVLAGAPLAYLQFGGLIRGGTQAMPATPGDAPQQAGPGQRPDTPVLAHAPPVRSVPKDRIAPPAKPRLAAEAAGPAAKVTPTPAETGEAVLMFAVSPWGEVYIDGKLRGVSPPLQQVRLSAGLHQIEIRNLSSPPYSETIDVNPQTTLKIKHKFN